MVPIGSFIRISIFASGDCENSDLGAIKAADPNSREVLKKSRRSILIFFTHFTGIEPLANFARKPLNW